MLALIKQVQVLINEHAARKTLIPSIPVAVRETPEPQANTQSTKLPAPMPTIPPMNTIPSSVEPINTSTVPDFQSAVAAIPDSVKDAFKTLLRGEINGVWPIDPKGLR